MKKIRFISLLLLCAVIVSSSAILSSCGKLGASLKLSKIDKAMSKLDSYEIHTTINLKYYVEDKPVDYESESTTIVSGAKNGDYYYYSLAEAEVTSDELDVDKTMMIVEAYKDGNFYLRNKTDGRRDIKLYGKMSLSKFQNYINTNGYAAIDLSDCTSVKETKNNDGTKTIEYSGYDSIAISTLVSSLGLYEYIFATEIKDVTITLVYDKDYRIRRLSYSFEFNSENGKTPVLSVWSSYMNYDVAERTDKYIKPSGYVEIENISVLTDVAIALNKLSNSTSGTFKYDFEQNVSFIGNKSNHKESNTVKYGTKNDKFFFEIDSLVLGENIRIEYRNGKQTVKGNGTAAKVIDSDSEAISYIINMMNPTGLSLVNVYDVVSLGDNVYELKCFTDKTACHNLISPYGATFSNATHTVKVTVSPYGDLTKMESYLEVDGYIRKGNSSYGLGLTIKATNEYTDN